MADAYRPRNPVKPLSLRQRQVAAAIGRGESYKQIASALDLTPGTVRQYVRSIAGLIPCDDELPPRVIVFLWVKQQDWARVVSRETDAA